MDNGMDFSPPHYKGSYVFVVSDRQWKRSQMKGQRVLWEGEVVAMVSSCITNTSLSASEKEAPIAIFRLDGGCGEATWNHAMAKVV